jgi:catechol 2,3-dioxygenase-like lactoylglutathione lyase family enzyme
MGEEAAKMKTTVRGLWIAILAGVLSCGNASAQAQAKAPELGGAKSLRPYLVALSVASLDVSVKWYEEMLGFKMLRRIEEPKYDVRIAFLELNGFRLELFEKKNSLDLKRLLPEPKDEDMVHGFRKLAFTVENIEGFAAALKNKKVKFLYGVTEDREEKQKWFIVADCDGNWLQFFEPMKPAPTN